MLYIVATPIGNMQDLSQRAKSTLDMVDIVLAEDTRTTGSLLAKISLKKKLLSYNDKNKVKRTTEAIQYLVQGSEIALVSENGTPLISDPGFYLVRAAIMQGIQVVPIPGPSAVTTALMAAGLPTNEFTFVGFLPKGPGRKQKLLEKLQGEARTFVFYESPYRIKKTISLMAEIMPEVRVALCRELTKKFEQIIRGTAKALAGQEIKEKGEFTVVVSPQK